MSLKEYIESFSNEREEYSYEVHRWYLPESKRDKVLDQLRQAICSGQSQGPFKVEHHQKWYVEGCERYCEGDQSRTIIEFEGKLYQFFYNEDSWEESGHASVNYDSLVNPVEVRPVTKTIIDYEVIKL